MLYIHIYIFICIFSVIYVKYSTHIFLASPNEATEASRGTEYHAIPVHRCVTPTVHAITMPYIYNYIIAIVHIRCFTYINGISI